MIILHRSLAVRLAALFFVLFTCAVSVVFAASYWVVRGESVERTRKLLVARADAISREASSSDVMLAAETARRMAALFDNSGTLLAGRAEFPMIVGWREVPARLVHLNEAGDEYSETALLYGRRVGDRILVLGEGMHVAEDTGEALLTGTPIESRIRCSCGLRRRQFCRRALLLMSLALAFYFGFIAIAVYRSRHG